MLGGIGKFFIELGGVPWLDATFWSLKWQYFGARFRYSIDLAARNGI